VTFAFVVTVFCSLGMCQSVYCKQVLAAMMGTCQAFRAMVRAVFFIASTRESVIGCICQLLLCSKCWWSLLLFCCMLMTNSYYIVVCQDRKTDDSHGTAVGAK